MIKKTASAKAIRNLRAGYHFDYSQSRPNRFADQIDTTAVVVVLDPDVAEVLTTPESVNAALRALINAIPQPAKRRATRKHPASSYPRLGGKAKTWQQIRNRKKVAQSAHPFIRCSSGALATDVQKRPILGYLRNKQTRGSHR